MSDSELYRNAPKQREEASVALGGSRVFSLQRYRKLTSSLNAVAWASLQTFHLQKASNDTSQN